jgi:type II secretory pathway component PulM
MLARAAFLIGLVIVPAVLLWLGHRLRDRTPRERGMFWGGIAGHTAALVIALFLLHVPPVEWTGGLREMLAFWVLLLGAAAGAALGALRSRA